MASLPGSTSRPFATPAKAEELCERIAATGALEQARERALVLVAEAKAALPAALRSGPARRRCWSRWLTRLSSATGETVLDKEARFVVDF